MSKTTAALMDSFESFIPFAESLKEVPNDKWHAPLKPGKWSAGAVIAHILLWDQYFWDHALAKIAAREKLTLKHIDYDTFNRKAPNYARSLSQEDLINETVSFRSGIIGYLRGLPEEDFYFEHIDGECGIFTVNGYLEGFVPHDDGHRREIEAFLLGG